MRRAAALVVAALVPLLPAAAQGAGSDRVVASPRPGEVVHSHHLKIRVRSSDLSGALRARLNGVEVGDEFGRAREGKRSLRTSVSHGLRHGRNVLEVRVRRRGAALRRERVTFRVRRHRPLVGAGRSRSVVVDTRSRLAGRVAPAPDGPRAGKARWKLVGGPTRNGKIRANLSSRAGLTAGFRPAVPGTYTLQLRQGAGDDAVRDRAPVKVLPPSPLVSVETFAWNGDSTGGIRVGDKLYSSEGKTGLQILVLDRATLGLVSNEVILPYDADALRRTVDSLKDTHLVIVTSAGQPRFHERISDLPTHQLLERIGVPPICGFDPTCDFIPYAGKFSAIGVPGMARGEADWNLNTDESEPATATSNSAMKGFLARDQYLNFGFVPSAREPFSYGAKEVAPCAAPPNCHQGYKVGIRDAKTLTPRPNDGQVFDLNGVGLTDAQKTAEAARMTDTLQAVADGDVVTIQAVSSRQANGGRYNAPVGKVAPDAMAKLGKAVASVGGTRNGFNRAALVEGPEASGGAVYTLVGWKGAPEGQGEEVASGVEGAGDVPVLSGVLQPDRSSQFRPVQATDSANDTDALSALMLAEPTSGWPLDDRPGAKKAIAYLGNQIPRLGGDPRAAYWTQPLDEGKTNAIITELGAISYPADAGFSQDDFTAARSQLIKELGWVGNVRAYLSDLATPFTGNELSSWVGAQKIADQVYEATQNPDEETAFRWLEVAEAILDLLGPATEEVTATIASAMEIGIATYGATPGGAPTDTEVRIKADELGAELVEQGQQSEATFDRIGDAIVSDYAKLSVLGPQGGCNDSSPDCRFPFSEADRVGATAHIYRSIERVAYEKLMPLGFRIFTLARRDRFNNMTRPNAPNPHDYLCNTFYHPWYGYPALASASALQELDPAGTANGWDTYVFAMPPKVSDQHGVPPSDAILTRMFDPPTSSTDPHAGGLGMSMTRLALESETQWWEGSEAQEYDLCGWEQ